MKNHRSVDVAATLKNILCLIPEHGIVLLKKNNEKRFEAFWNQAKNLKDVDCYRSENQIIIKSKKYKITNFII